MIRLVHDDVEDGSLVVQGVSELSVQGVSKEINVLHEKPDTIPISRRSEREIREPQFLKIREGRQERDVRPKRRVVTDNIIWEKISKRKEFSILILCFLSILKARSS